MANFRYSKVLSLRYNINMARNYRSLIEAVTAVFVLGIVFALVWPKFQGAQVTHRKKALQNILDAVMAYEIEYGPLTDEWACNYENTKRNENAWQITRAEVQNYPFCADFDEAHNFYPLWRKRIKLENEIVPARLFRSYVLTEDDPQSHAGVLTWVISYPVPGRESETQLYSCVGYGNTESCGDMEANRGCRVHPDNIFAPSNGLDSRGCIVVLAQHEFENFEPNVSK